MVNILLSYRLQVATHFPSAPSFLFFHYFFLLILYSTLIFFNIYILTLCPMQAVLC